MKQTRIRVYANDGDTVHITESLHETSGMWIGDFTAFDAEERYTPNGRPWVDITCGEECPYCDSGNDGSKCSYFGREREKDLIGVCFHDENKKACE